MKNKNTKFYAELDGKTVLLGQTLNKDGADEDDLFPKFLINNLQVISQSIKESYFFTTNDSSVESTLKTLMLLIELGMKIYATSSSSTPINLIYCQNPQEPDSLKRVYFGREVTLKLFGIDFTPFPKRPSA